METPVPSAQPELALDLVPILERLDRLESENQRLVGLTERLVRERRGGRRWLSVAVASVGLIALVGASAQVGDVSVRATVVEASRFVVRDAEGRERARLAMGEDHSPRLVFSDDQGRVRLQISVAPNGSPGVRLLDETQKAEAGLAVSGGGRPGLVLNDQSGRTRASLTIQQDGGPTLNLRDEKGKARVVLDASPDGAHGLSLRDSDENLRLSAVILPGGFPGLNVVDGEGNPRVAIQTTPDGEARFRVLSRRNGVLFEVPAPVTAVRPARRTETRETVPKRSPESAD
ncbi:MAG: hypothetical protein AB7I30_00500 [Isosphaeraceae bacterium]